MPFDAARYPDAVTRVADRSRHGCRGALPSVRPSRRGAGALAAVCDRNAGACARWSVQMHALRIHVDTGAAGMAKARVTAAISFTVFGASSWAASQAIWSRLVCYFNYHRPGKNVEEQA